MREGGQNEVVGAARHRRLAQTVPESARTVVIVGPRDDRIAAALKERRPAPIVYGVDTPTGGGPAEHRHFDDFFELDLEVDVPPLEAGSVDSIVYPDSLPRLCDPLGALQRHRPLLAASGTISCSVPNLQHHSVVRGLLRGVFPYGQGTLLDPSFLRFFTSASIVQLLLDGGYAPDTVDRVVDGDDERMVSAGAPLFELLDVGAQDAERDLGTAWLLVRGQRLSDLAPGEEIPLTFVACVNDDEQLGANLMHSPCLRSPGPHELLVFRGCASAAEGLNAGIEQAKNELVVLVHQDVYIPRGWPARMVAQWSRAQQGGGPVGIAGVFGVLDRRVPFDAIGRVVHRDRLLSHRQLPSDVDGLDELLMVVPADTPLRVDPSLGWHLYGTDLALQAQQREMRVVVVDAPCHHNSLTGRVPAKYRDSERVLARKWQNILPIHTNLSSIGSWLIEGDDAGASGATQGPAGDHDQPGPELSAVAELVTRLRREQVSLNVELEQARLQVASMQASPFWRAREVYACLRRLLWRRG